MTSLKVSHLPAGPRAGGELTRAAGPVIHIGEHLSSYSSGDASGRALAGLGGPDTPRLFYDSPELAPHRDRPWLLAHLRERYGLELAGAELPSQARRARQAQRGALSVPASLLGRHAVLCGRSGSGKTRLALHLLQEQLRLGCSALVLDVKSETIRQCLACAERAGLDPEQITLLWPQQPADGVPGWNPFAVGPDSVRQSVREFVNILAASATSWGPRLQDVLTNAATVIAGQRLSLLELTRFLQSEDYREGLLQQAHSTPAWQQFQEEHEYFTREFAPLSRGERAAAVAPVLNKIRALVSTRYLRSLLCARRDTLDLPSLWQRQRLVLVHLDSWELGGDGVRLLAGMLSHALFHTAMRHSGPVPVVLCMDEMGLQERFVGAALKDILAVARSQNLRLLAACQHLDQLSDGLRTALLTNTAFRAFFQLGPEDARIVARSLATGVGGQVARVAIDVAHEAQYDPVTQRLEPAETVEVSHAVVNMHNRPLAMTPCVWEEFARVQSMSLLPENATAPDRRLAVLQLILHRAGVPRTYVRAPGSGTPYELGAYLRGLEARCFYFTGPAPLRLVVVFPRPRVSVLGRSSEDERVRELTRTLMQLPVQQAIVRLETGAATCVRVADSAFPDGLPEATRFLSSGQSGAEIAQTEAERRGRMEEIAARHAGREHDETDGESVPPHPSARRPAQATARQAAGRGASARRMAASRRPSSLDACGPAPRQAQPPSPLPNEPEVADDGSL